MYDLSSSDKFKRTLDNTSSSFQNRSTEDKCINKECPEFTFHSGRHQRYESGEPTMGLQVCRRTVKVEKNINGCSGYRLEDGDGYLVRMINDDLGRDQMAPKPMRVVSSAADKVELRGYKVQAMTPFGWRSFDLSDYGLTVCLDKGMVGKCVLHMFDRGVDLEYDK